MNTEIQIIEKQEVLGRMVNVYGSFENPLFLAKDVAEWIDYSQTNKGAYKVSEMLQYVDEDEKLMTTLLVSGQKRNVWLLTENGLHDVLIRNFSYKTKRIRKEVKKITKEIHRKGMLLKATKIMKDSIKQEIWREIPGFEGYYEVSNIGRIKSAERSFIDKNGKKTRYPSKVLKVGSGKTSPYLVINLSVNNVAKKYLVHRLVAMSFLSNWEPDCEINHIDGNVYNNNINNLEMCTRKENCQHSIDNKLKNDSGQFSSNAKLSNIDAERIRKLNDLGVMQKDLATVFNVHKQTINNIVNLTTYRQCK